MPLNELWISDPSRILNTIDEKSNPESKWESICKYLINKSLKERKLNPETFWKLFLSDVEEDKEVALSYMNEEDVKLLNEVFKK